MVGTTGEGAAVACVPLSAWAQPARVAAETTVEGAALTSDRLYGVGSVTELAGRTSEGSAPASVISVGVGGRGR